MESNLQPYVKIALNSRNICNNNISSNQMLQNIQIQTRITNSNDLRAYMMANANTIMQNNINTLTTNQLPFNNNIRPNELTNTVCNSNYCEVKINDSNGIGQGRMCDR